MRVGETQRGEIANAAADIGEHRYGTAALPLTLALRAAILLTEKYTGTSAKRRPNNNNNNNVLFIRRRT